MSNKDKKILGPARRYVESIDLPLAPAPLEAVEASTGLDGGQKAITVGSQLTEFDPKVPVDIRSAVSNCILLAQLAANKATEVEGNTYQWYSKYSEVLYNVGWLLMDLEFVEQEIADADAELHEAIIPIVSMMLGPQLAAASVLLAVLEGLKSMEKDRPWLTLFERESQRFTARQFQISYADLDQAGQPKISLLCFGLEAHKTITQVLFFKFTDESAVLRKHSTTLNINTQILQTVQADLAAKLTPYISSYIKEIEI